MDEARVAEVLADAGVRAAYLFGSYVAGTSAAGSDVDVAILAGRPVDLLEEQRLAARLEAVAGSPVDLVVLDHASLELRGHVVQEGRLLLGADEPARVAFEVRTRSEYFDFEPTLRAHTARYLRQRPRRLSDRAGAPRGAEPGGLPPGGLCRSLPRAGSRRLVA